MRKVRSVAATSMLLVLVLSSAALAGGDLRWELWGENATAGGGAEGAHAWISHGLYSHGTDLGLERVEAAGLALAIMGAWEICEVELMDAEGVSVQDLVANSAGVAAGVLGLDVRHSYATYGRPETDEERPWLGVPILPRNDLTYAVEIVHEDWTLGYKFMAHAGDVVVGTTSMPVQPGDRGKERVIAFVGREWENGLHAAVGYDGLGEVSVGGGYRLVLAGLGMDITALGDSDGLGIGLSWFLDYGSVLER